MPGGARENVDVSSSEFKLTGTNSHALANKNVWGETAKLPNTDEIWTKTRGKNSENHYKRNPYQIKYKQRNRLDPKKMQPRCGPCYV